MLITGSILPDSVSTTGASAVFLNTVMSASANNQTLVGLDVYPKFINSSFTGISNIGTRIYGSPITTTATNPILRLQSATGSNITTTGQVWLEGLDTDGTAFLRIFTHTGGNINGLNINSPNNKNIVLNSGGNVTIINTGNNTGRLSLGLSDGTLAGGANLSLQAGATTVQRIFTSGNTVFQNGGTFVDNGYRVQINGLDSDSLYVSGLSSFTGSLAVSGSTSLSGPLSVTGSTSLSGSLEITGSFTALAGGTQVSFNGDPFSMTRLGSSLRLYAAYGGFGNDAAIYSTDRNLSIISSNFNYICLADPIYSFNGIGVNTREPEALLDVNGSGRYRGGLTVTGSLNVSGSITATGTTITTNPILRLQAAAGANTATNGQTWLNLLDNTGASLFSVSTMNAGSTNSLLFGSSKTIRFGVGNLIVYNQGTNGGRLQLGLGAEGQLVSTSNLTIGVGAAGESSFTAVQKIFTSGDTVFQNAGTFVDNGYRVQINGSGSASGSLSVNGYTVYDGSISGSQPTNNPSSSLLIITGSVFPDSVSTTGASAVVVNTVISASADNQALIGLDINPNFRGGSFTGVKTIGARISGNALNSGTQGGGVLRLQAAPNSNTAANGQLWIDGVDNTGTSIFYLYTHNAGSNNGLTFASINRQTIFQTSQLFIFNPGNNTGKILLGTGNGVVNSEGTLQAADNLLFNAGSTTMQKIFTSGDTVFQNGGTFVDNGYRVQIKGSDSESDSLYVSGLSSFTGSLKVSGSTSLSGPLSIGGFSGTQSSARASYSGDPFTLSRLGNQLKMYAANSEIPRPLTNHSVITSNFFLTIVGNMGNYISFPYQLYNGIGVNTITPRALLDVNGSGRYAGGLTVTGSLNVSGDITTTGTITAQILVVQTVTSSIIYSSGSNIFGSLITDTQTMTGSVNITGSLSIIESLLLNQNASSLAISAQTISTNATASYTSAFYNYTLASGSNARAGQMIAVWSGSAIQYMDNSTTDIGNTSLVALTASLSSGNVLLTTVLPTDGWKVKTLVNLL